MSHRSLIQTVQPPLRFIPEQFNPLVFNLARQVLPIVMRVRLRPWLPAGITEIKTVNVEQLVQLYQQFQAGKVRFLMAFRHAEVDDPLSLAYLLTRAVPQVAHQEKITLQPPLYAHFLYDRGMTLWAGDWLGWFFSRMGGIPIHRGKKLDRIGIRTARERFLNGKLPMMAAPEGATNGHSEVVSPLEPGVAQLSFWCAQDLNKAHRTETVWVVPISIQYSYPQPPWKNLDRLLSQLEADTGLPIQPIVQPSSSDDLHLYYQRLIRLAEHLLMEMEQFYCRFSHQEFCPPAFSDALDGAGVHPEAVLAAQLQRVIDRALQVAEQHFNLLPQGTVIERCRRLEEATWSDIYREDLLLQQMAPFQRGLADWIATAAELRGRHMRLVESFVAVSANHLKEKPTVERFAELALLMFDLVAKIKGDQSPARPRLGWRRSTLTVGEPISVSDRYSDYASSRTAAKQAVKQLTQDLQTALEKLIV